MGIAAIHVVDEAATPPTTTVHCEISLMLRHMPLLAAEVQDIAGQDAEVGS
jgi:hypothetical protein